RAHVMRKIRSSCSLWTTTVEDSTKQTLQFFQVFFEKHLYGGTVHKSRLLAPHPAGNLFKTF
ncbi:MAG: hypothetical protein JXN59_03335, partial [Anaerolineae bacterium]|nr:hypothetical protein [Anaerolineae bacterium]